MNMSGLALREIAVGSLLVAVDDERTASLRTLLHLAFELGILEKESDLLSGAFAMAIMSIAYEAPPRVPPSVRQRWVLDLLELSQSLARELEENPATQLMAGALGFGAANLAVWGKPAVTMETRTTWVGFLMREGPEHAVGNFAAEKQRTVLFEAFKQGYLAALLNSPPSHHAGDLEAASLILEAARVRGMGAALAESLLTTLAIRAATSPGSLPRDRLDGGASAVWQLATSSPGGGEALMARVVDAVHELVGLEGDEAANVAVRFLVRTFRGRERRTA
jgi:hypothetical protein